MNKFLAILARLVAFWLIIFAVNRLVFIIYFFSKFSSVSLSEVLLTFIHGLKLDISMTCYLLVIPLAMLFIQELIHFRFYKTFLLVYVIVVLVINSFFSVFDLAIYADWGTKLTYRAISYLSYANEGTAFTKLSDDLILFMLMAVQVVTGILFFKKIFSSFSFHFSWNRKTIIPGLALHLLIFPWLFLGIRGGWQQIPINESSAYFSSNQVVNDAAVNTLWNAGKKFSSGSSALNRNPYHFLSGDEAAVLVERLYATGKDSVTEVLTTGRPNIVLFILESFTADVIEQLGGEKGVTPNLDALIDHGLLFTNIYSQGFRTDQGLADVLSGFPAQPNFSIIMQPEKFRKLDFLSQTLATAGYHNSFFYGGETGFANMKAYLLDGGINNITDKSSFSSGQMNAKWGAHDGFVFQTQAKNISGDAVPFFSVILSLSSHEPFVVPMKTKFPGSDDPSKFKNSCAYTDKCIGEYFESVKSLPWYHHTLFIFVADHGHILPRNRNPKEAARFHIPLIFYGDVLKPEFRGTKNEVLGMQADLPATILAQLHFPHQSFHWSNDLLNPSRNNFAYYTSDDAFGWITDQGSMVYDFKTGSIEKSDLDEKGINSGKAFLQTLFDEYISF